MKYLATLILLFILGQAAQAQPFTIKGTVTDTLTLSRLPHASAVLIRASDSVMETFTRANDSGTFVLHPGSAGKYLLLITFPNFADYRDVITLKDKKNVDIGVVPMVSKSHLLQEFVIKRQLAAIKIKGDTIEYVADSFKVRDNATVEDLLKRLPGLEVDKDGNVTAQGEKVEKIMVDGEEFFSDDPAVVTKSLQAKVIDKVQVFDKKSDQAAFTGIDDGQKTKTINLELKDNAKHGYFGKIDAGGGTDGYFQNQGMINLFRDKLQVSVFGIMANTGKAGLGWNDAEKYGLSNANTEINDDGQVISYYSSTDDDFNSWDGTYNGQGLPTVWTGGVHVADKWNQDQDHITGNYRAAKQNIEMEGNTITQYVLPDSQYFTKQHTDQFSTGERQQLNFMYEKKIDSTSSIKISTDAGYKQNEVSSVYSTQSLDANDSIINSNNRKITSNAISQVINTDIIYRKKFAKKGRSLSVDVKENYTQGSSSGHLFSNTIYGDSTSNIDQRKDNENHTLAFSSKVTYTEPISKVAFAELNYGLTINNSYIRNNSYNPSGGDTYNALDSLYSSNYQYNVMNNSGGLNFRFIYNKVRFSFGSNLADTKYKQENLYQNDSIARYNYFNLFPRASFTYKFSKQSNLSINYFGNTTQPTIEQIAPLRQNTDPLNIAIGNPNLKQEFNNHIYAYFNSYKVLSGQWIYIGANFTSISNQISQATNVDSVGRRTYQYINVNGYYNGYVYGGLGYKIKHTDFNVGGNTQLNVTHSINYINGVKNTSNNNVYSFNLSADYYKDQKYSISFKPGISYNDNRATISTYATSFWESNDELEATVQLPHDFEINSTVNWHIRERTVIFDQNNNVLLWTAYISKKFLKSKQLELRAYVNDILNQNIGYQRYGSGYTITENTYNTIGRYGMLSLIWNFSKTVSGGANQNQTINLK